jgi:hypothetical protein
MNNPQWTSDLIAAYKSGASNQFIIHGNVTDRMMVPYSDGAVQVGTLDDFFLQTLFGPFDLVLTYDVGNGLRVVKGDKLFGLDVKDLPTSPLGVASTISQYLRFVSSHNAKNNKSRHVAVVIKDANLVAGSAPAYSFEANATASLIRDWSSLSEFTNNGFATFLITENVADLHPLLTNNDRASRFMIPLPSLDDLKAFFDNIWLKYPTPLSGYTFPNNIAEQLVGVTLGELESVLKINQHQGKVLKSADFVRLKKHIIEKQADGLIEFIESDETLDALVGQDRARDAIREQLFLWKENDCKAMSMGILFAAPVGVGKTFLIHCIAGESGYPVILVKNFRSKWVGESEAKQEKIKRLIHGIGRCFVFFDEADAVLGRRDGSDTDGGMSARIYAGWATEMSNTKNRGQIVWLLATSRADLIEIDLKRPGRIDVIVPLFPSPTPKDGFTLLQALCKRDDIDLPDTSYAVLNTEYVKYDENNPTRAIEHGGVNLIPKWLTAGAAESLSKKIYLRAKTKKISGEEAAKSVLEDYAPPVSLMQLEQQIRIAADNCSDIAFIPPEFREYRSK